MNAINKRVLLVALALSACSWFGKNPSTIDLSDTVHGQTPEDAHFAVFGASQVGTIDASVSQIMLIASSDPDICTAIGNDLSSFLSDVQAGKVGGTTVTIVLTKLNDLPTPGQEFQGNGQDARVDLRFVISDGATVLAAAANTQGDAFFRVGTFSPGQEFSGKTSGVLNADETGGSPAGPLDVTLSGGFGALLSCPAISDGISNGVVFQGF